VYRDHAGERTGVLVGLAQRHVVVGADRRHGRNFGADWVEAVFHEQRLAHKRRAEPLHLEVLFEFPEQPPQVLHPRRSLHACPLSLLGTYSGQQRKQRCTFCKFTPTSASYQDGLFEMRANKWELA
jgi:hypothetical protein